MTEGEKRVSDDSNDIVIRAWEEARERVDFRGRMEALSLLAVDSPEAKAVLVGMDSLLGDFGVEILRSFVDELTREVKGESAEEL